ncbi:AMP-binding protein [Amycolatopsis sp. La24]|uniref:AMP-binding protein n=1 Tax=Amycolatopsis sp. La24 TaxID=3028304 RepID=UPI0023AFEFFD|nr:AMP-binding protein [Amycolatopsis sp. La24]
MNLATLLTQTARRIPDRVAVVHGATRWTWRDLDERTDALAAALRERGVHPGDCVLLHSPNHPEFIQAMFAVWRAGAVLAPTNSRLTPDDVAGIAGVCRPVAMLVHPDGKPHADAVREKLPLPAGTLLVDADGADSISALPACAEKPGDTEVGTEDHAWYFFTSGTSGTPKAAVLTHDQMGFVVVNHIADLMPGLGENDVSLAVAPLSHGAGIHLLPQVARGAATVIPESRRLDGDEVWSLVERERVSNMFTVPTILKALAEHPAVDQHEHSSLRHVIYAGAPMFIADQERARAAVGEVLVQYYGLGEVTGNITVLPPSEHGRPRPDGVEIGTCGRPRTSMQVSIRAGGTELPAGQVGEICVAGPAVCAGYLDNPSANSETFEDGWFHTGDLGMLDPEGYLYITGRASDMYISGGSNVFPRDIEEKLLGCPGIAEVAVLGMPDPKWGEVGVALWVPEAGAELTDDDVLQWLVPRIARYKLPRHVLKCDELPKSGYGKIVKRTIREDLLTAGWPPAETAGGARR